MPSLFIASGDQVGATHQLGKPATTVGRDRGCEIRLTEDHVSRRHFQICKRGERYAIRELKSLNGVELNGTRISGERMLRDGDRIQVGYIQMIFRDSDDPNRTKSVLLARVKDTADDEAWGEFHQLYAPLLWRYAKSRGLSADDADEVRDQCLEVLVRKMEGFEYDRRKGRFKGWLNRMVSGKVIDLLRRPGKKDSKLDDVEKIEDLASTPDEHWERHWEKEHLRYCIEKARSGVSDKNYRAFCMMYLEGASVKEVSERLGISADQVYKARSRVGRRVRQILTALDPHSTF